MKSELIRIMPSDVYQLHAPTATVNKDFYINWYAQPVSITTMKQFL